MSLTSFESDQNFYQLKCENTRIGNIIITAYIKIIIQFDSGREENKKLFSSVTKNHLFMFTDE